MFLSNPRVLRFFARCLLFCLAISIIIVVYEGVSKASATECAVQGTTRTEVVEKSNDIVLLNFNRDEYISPAELDIQKSSDNLQPKAATVTVNQQEPETKETPEIQTLSISESEEQKDLNKWNIILTADEIDLLAKIVWWESQGESDKGQQAVVETVLNRMIHWDFEGNLYDVLSKKSAFSTWKKRNSAHPTEKEYDNIQKVLAGKTNITDFETVYFSTSPRNDDITIHIGGHYFCRYELKKK